MGLVKVRENIIIDTEYYLIKPPLMDFAPANIAIHGITPEMVQSAPLFSDIWQKINYYFQGDEVIIAHNAHFDMSVLMNCLTHYELDIPDFPYICSIPISNQVCLKQNIKNSLAARAEYFGIELNNQHNALDDAITCAQIVIASVQTKKKTNLSKYCSTYSSIPQHLFSELKMQTSLYQDKRRSRFNKISIKEIAATTENFNLNHLFYGKNIVLTGDLISMDRKTAMQRIVNVGGILKSGVSSKTDFLIVGVQDKKIVGGDGLSTKEERAHELINRGYNLKILNEEEFLKVLSLGEVI
jgi:DNA polymerase-3 subunit epsilon